MNLIYVYNFKINVDLLTARPPAMLIDNEVKSFTCKVDFHRKNRKDYIELTGHQFFDGLYEIQCIDENCCEIIIKKENIFLQLIYNGDLPYGKSRICH